MSIPDRLTGYEVGVHLGLNYILDQIMDRCLSDDDREEVKDFLSGFADNIKEKFDHDISRGVVDRIYLFLELYDDDEDQGDG